MDENSFASLKNFSKFLKNFLDDEKLSLTKCTYFSAYSLKKNQLQGAKKIFFPTVSFRQQADRLADERGAKRPSAARRRDLRGHKSGRPRRRRRNGRIGHKRRHANDARGVSTFTTRARAGPVE